jgi:predicted nucleotidyltransferase
MDKNLSDFLQLKGVSLLLNAKEIVEVLRPNEWLSKIIEKISNSDKEKAILKECGDKGDYVGVGSCILGYQDCEQPKAAPSWRAGRWAMR